MPIIRKLFVLTHPINLLFALLTYGMGLGFSRYLGVSLRIESQFMGGFAVLLLIASSRLLTEYFRPFNEPLWLGETKLERIELHQYLLTVSLSCLGAVVVLLFLLYRDGFMNVEVALFALIFVILALMNAVPPFRLVNHGFGELSDSLQIACITPILAFLLQYGKFNRVLTIFTIPLLFIALAYFLALNFPSYAEDLKYERKTMLTRLSWERGIPIHDMLLAVAYFSFAAVPFLGISFDLVWPALLTLPISAYQVIVLRNISDGAKPNWPLFSATSAMIFGLTVYLIVLTFWLH